MNAIEIKALTKKYKTRTAVDALTMDIGKGEFFALLGQNGAGKTTTIKMLSCLAAPTSGDAVVAGHSIISDPEAVKEKINVSPQETAVAPNLTLRENLIFIARIYGKDKNQAAEAADAMLERFSLSGRARERASTLSGGMQRRLSIAMALISEPEVLFLDEPTLGLDVRARRELWDGIKALKGKITVILTTHYLEEAEALADRIAIIERGRIVALGTTAEIEAQTGKPSLEDAFLALTEKNEEDD